MNLYELENLKVGDVVFNIFQEELVVHSITKDISNQSYIVCVNTRFGIDSYDSKILYRNLNDLTIPEYSFLLWVSKNKKQIQDFIDNDVLNLIRQTYLEAYSQGFSDKPRCSGNKCKGKNNAMD
jgi:hypothetical protein